MICKADVFIIVSLLRRTFELLFYISSTVGSLSSPTEAALSTPLTQDSPVPFAD